MIIMKGFIAQNRLKISKAILLTIIILLSISVHQIERNSFLYDTLEAIGFLLVLIGVFGRIWSSLYIEGRKTKELINQGSYAVMRNPLYFFSFILMIGFCFAIKSILIAALFLIIWILLYINTIKDEENILYNLHRKKYEQYKLNTPKIFPKFSLFKKTKKNKKIIIYIRNIERVLIESFGFIVFGGLLKILEHLHLNEILPIIFYLR